MANTEKQFLDEEGLEIVRNNTFIAVFDTWEEYEEAKDTVPEGMKFIVREDEQDPLEKMDRDNPWGTGSLSINRPVDSEVGGFSVVAGANNEASGYCSVALGQDNIAKYAQSVAVGYGNKVYCMNGFAEGSDNTLGDPEDTTVTGAGANGHVEGAGNTVVGVNGHAQGYHCVSAAPNSMAGGSGSRAMGANSTALGAGVTVYAVGGLTCGRDNVPDTSGQYLFTVGNGTSNEGGEPHDAFNVRANGDAIVSGRLFVDGIMMKDQVTGQMFIFTIQSGEIVIQPYVGDRGPG